MRFDAARELFPMTPLEPVHKLIRAGEHERALRAYEQALTDPASRLKVLGDRAWFFLRLGRYEEALADYDEVLSQTPNDTEAAALRAQVLAKLGQCEEAMRAAVDVLVVDPCSATALEVMNFCHRQAGLAPRKAAPPSGHESPPPVRPLNPVLDALERDPASYPASVYPEIGRFLYGFVRMGRPRLVLETGAYVGYSSLCIAQALEDNEEGHLHSFDLFLDRTGYVSPVLGPQQDGLAVARGHLERAGLSHRVTFHKGDSSTTIRRLLAPGGARFDLAFIDGDHTLRGCLKDWQAVDELLQEGGFVLLHDTMPEACGWLGPRHLLEELGRRAASDYHWINLPSPEGFGLGIIQKRSAGAAPRWMPTAGESIRQWLFDHARRR